MRASSGRSASRLLTLATLLITIPASASDASKTMKPAGIIGEWKIRSVLDYATISIGPDQAKRLIEKDLIISEEKIRFGDQVCSESNFLAERVETNIELRENARVSNNQLRLPNPVTVVELSCAYVYIKDRNRIVLAWNGIFSTPFVRSGRERPCTPDKIPLPRSRRPLHPAAERSPASLTPRPRRSRRYGYESPVPRSARRSCRRRSCRYARP